MNGIGKLMRRDWVIALGLLLVSIALRVPFRSQYAYHWDSAEFCVAISDYNVALSQPHPPGYFLYVMLGRLVNHFVGDPNASLVWISVVFGSALVSILYLLGTTMFDRRAGWTAALIGMTSPQCWFHSCVALMYVVDAFLVCLIVWWCWRAIQHGGSWLEALLIGGTLAVAGGVRQQTVPGLLPLVLYTFWKFQKQRAAKLAVAGGVALLGALAWLIPMVQMSGGMRRYWEVVRRFSSMIARSTVARHGFAAFLENLASIAAFLWIGLLAAVVLLAGGLVYRAFWMNSDRRQNWNQLHGPALTFLAWWIVPLVILNTVVGLVDQPGHVFSYFPAFLLLAGVVAAQLRRTWAFILVVSLVCAVNVGAFLAWPTAWDGWLFGWGRTAREIRQHDELWARTIHLVRSQFRPADTLICHADEDFRFGLRQFQVYLPEFDQYLFPIDPAMDSPPGKPRLGVRHGRLEFMAGPPMTGRRFLLLVVPPGTTVEMFRGVTDLTKAAEVPGARGTLQTLPVEAFHADLGAPAKPSPRQQLPPATP